MLQSGFFSSKIISRLGCRFQTDTDYKSHHKHHSNVYLQKLAPHVQVSESSFQHNVPVSYCHLKVCMGHTCTRTHTQKLTTYIHTSCLQHIRIFKTTLYVQYGFLQLISRISEQLMLYVIVNRAYDNSRQVKVQPKSPFSGQMLMYIHFLKINVQSHASGPIIHV